MARRRIYGASTLLVLAALLSVPSVASAGGDAESSGVEGESAGESGSDGEQSDDAGASSSARDQYRERFLWFPNTFSSAVKDSNKKLIAGTTSYQGVRKEEIRGGEIYEILDRPELAAQYRRNVAIKWAMFGAGSVASLVGFVYILNPGWFRPNCAAACTQTWPGWGLLLAGSVLGHSGRYFVPRHPVSPDEARELIRQYNGRLKEELGLPESYSPLSSTDSGPSDPQYRFRVTYAPRGAGLEFGFRF